ncbi:MAG: alpha/beta hydrolase [Candidatus Pacebacteria bacterium]|nr:alpha/beta hydrolase [Candidatus Paceibacterota bacterium]
MLKHTKKYIKKRTNIWFLKLAVFALILLLPIAVRAATDVSGATITSDTVWNAEDSPYYISDSTIVSVQDGATLTIEEGAIVKFGDNARMYVRQTGVLIVNGATENPVFFTSLKDDSAGGDTNGDGFSEGAPNDEWLVDLSKYSGPHKIKGLVWKYSNDGLRATRADTVFEDTHFLDSVRSVIANNGTYEFKNITLNNVNDGLSCGGGGTCLFSDITIENLTGGSGITVGNATATFENITVTNAGSGLAINISVNAIASANRVFLSGGRVGIEVSAGSGERGHLELADAVIQDFIIAGVKLTGGSASIASTTITNNFDGVLGVCAGVFSCDIRPILEIHDSSIAGNSNYGVNFYSSLPSANPDIADATNNWWGDASGPRNPVNPLGTGDGVVGDVDFDPWLTEYPLNILAPECCSSVLFLPGLEASRLYKPDYSGGTDILWEPNNNGDVEALFLDENGQSARFDIYTKDVIGEVRAFGFIPLWNIYKSFLSDLETWKNDERIIADYSTVPYDWRLSLNDILSYGNKVDEKIYYSGDLRATSTPYIIQELNRLAETSKTGKVSIVAHSNGGLVVKYLLKKLENENSPLLEKIDNVFLVAVPQAGTPMAIGALLHGFDQGLPKDWFDAVVSRSTAREFAQNMPGAYPLLPSASYWLGEGGGITTPPIRFEGSGYEPIDDAVAEYGDTIDTKEELWSFLKGEEGDGRESPLFSDLSSPEVLNEQLLAYADSAHNEIDDFIPPSRIDIYEIAGWGEETLSSIVYKGKNKCVSYLPIGDNFFCEESELVWDYKPKLVVDGDGIVVTPSALAMSTSSPNVKRWWVNLNSYNNVLSSGIHVPREHKNILEIPQLVELIKNKIEGTTTTPQFVTDYQPSVGESDNRLYFYLHSPLGMTAVDSFGNTLSSTTSAIPGGRYKHFGEVQYISIPKQAAPVINLSGFASGSFDLEIEESSNGVIIAATMFESIPVATTTKASISFPLGTIENASSLDVDFDNDGETDISLEPVIGGTVTLPPIPVDDIPPEARIGFSMEKNGIEITGIDETTQEPVVLFGDKSTTITDEWGNTLAVSYDLAEKKRQSLISLNLLTYGTTTKAVYNENAFARYHYAKHPRTGKSLIFISHLKTVMDNLIAIYEPSRDRTKIISVSKNTNDINLESVEKKLPKGAIIREIINGLVIPYLETEKGEVIIKY